ncbi:uncharacterized protein LOC121645717 [Melanotaenia boesemani]|uniref:uncharacterized protein LOC121645717 n=1 Tax=Melanotaenia boesemani TaxID=1250792 RepID=UPI001C04E964|nr:uncharacterized protein LOC121645717 [Melanotaenia boesemani]
MKQHFQPLLNLEQAKDLVFASVTVPRSDCPVEHPDRTTSPTQPGLSRTPTTSQSPDHTATRSPASSFTTSVSSPEEDNLSNPEWEDPQQAECSSASDHSASGSEAPNDTATSRNEWLSKSGMISWAPTEAETLPYTPSRCLAEGPTDYARRRIHDIQSCLELFVTEEILQLVLGYTNLDGQRTDGEGWEDISMMELKAFIGLLILVGVYRSRDETTRSLWAEGTGRAIFKATMSQKKFGKIAAMLRFDDQLHRPRRMIDTRLAAIWPVWESWAPRLQMVYNPGVEVCVDEQLVPFRGRCPFVQYFPHSSDRYGIKVWTAYDAKTSYTWKMSVCTWKQNEAISQLNQGKTVLLDLAEGLGGHTVMCDSFFTSCELGEELLKRKIAMVGMMKKNNPELPRALLEVRQRAILSAVFAFTKTHTAVSYIPNRGKNVILLSTKHREPAVSTRRLQKPLMVTEYNNSKGRVKLDKVFGAYSCRQKTHRWTQRLFYHILDVSAYNAFILWMCLDPGWKAGITNKRRLFLEELGKAMVTPLMQQRQRLPRNPTAIAVVNAARARYPEDSAPITSSGRRRQCHTCRKMVSNVCCRCGHFVCKAHLEVTCFTCSSGDLD